MKLTVRLLFVILGIFSAGLGLDGFLIPNGLIDGGVTGTSMLTSKLSGIPLPIMIMLINTPFIILGAIYIRWQFALYGALAITGLAIVLSTVHFPQVTDDTLLSAIFGGVFLGGGIGFAMRGGSVLDGTEILAILTYKKLSLTVGDFIMLFNTMLFSIGAIILGIETALYSILAYFSASKTIDFLLYGIGEYIGVMVMSPKSNEIQSAIVDDLKRGATIFDGRGGYSRDKKDILFFVITRFEIPKFKQLISAIDPDAFIVMNKLNDAIGGVHKQKRF